MRLRWKVVVACTPAIVIQGLDVTMINLAIPSMGEELSAQLADLQWIVAGFALAMVSVLPMSAAIGDMYGRRRALLLGYGILAFGPARRRSPGFPRNAPRPRPPRCLFPAISEARSGSPYSARWPPWWPRPGSVPRSPAAGMPPRRSRR